jgi:DNA-binding Lrp family transcriptional regulator
MVSSYVLIQVDMGKASDVASAIRAIGGVVSADIATGPYDIIAKASADTMDDLGRMVVGQIEMVPGITRTLTCPVVNL